MDPYARAKEDRFSFGLWTVGNPGADPFGDPVRPPRDAAYLVRKLAECGAWGVNLHDNDLVPFGASAAERDRIVKEFKRVLADTGMVVLMATTNLSRHPVFIPVLKVCPNITGVDGLIHPSCYALESNLATPRGFEPPISTVTGWHVRPLHHGAAAGALLVEPGLF